MKTHAALSSLLGLLPLTLGLLAGSPLPCRATPLAATAAVQTQPDPASPVIAYLKAGSEPTPAPDGSIAPPPGWMTVALPGPFEAYVMDKDFTKGLDVRPGSSLYLAPKPDAGVLAISAAGDKIVITGLDGRWTQVRLEKKIVGYVNLAPLAAPAAVTTAALAPAPEGAPVAGTAAPQNDSSLPRSLEGKFVATHRLIGPRPPFPWQLNDASGARLAYLDLRKLLFTDQTENYAGRTVIVYGTVTALPEGTDLVIAVESLRLK